MPDKRTVFIVLIAVALAAGAAVRSSRRRAQERANAAEFIASAQESIRALAVFEETYRSKTGLYTSDVEALASLFGDRAKFHDLVAKTMDPASLKIASDAKGYVIDARALDRGATPVEIKGPLPPRPPR